MGHRGIPVDWDHPLFTVSGIPGLYALEGWVEEVERLEEEQMAQASNTSGNVQGSARNQSKMSWKSNVPSDHKRGR